MRKLGWVVLSLAFLAGPAEARHRREPPPDEGDVYLPCRTNSDCGGSGMCRDVGLPYQVCLDHEPPNSPCEVSGDCGEGGMCRDRGDGLKVCMDHQRRGEFCGGNSDCTGGLMCRDRGDGLKVCMG